MFRFIHSGDLHLGRRFGNLPEDCRGRLIEARHQIISTLAETARAHDARHILIAGDTFDSETPGEPVLRQALAAMGADTSRQWWLIAGNHDSLAAGGLWPRFRDHAPANVHLLDSAEPVEIEPGVVVLPAPLPRRYPGRDLTATMPAQETDPRALRIGLAHGAIRSFGPADVVVDGIIPPDRAETARLDYLALGDWHGHLRVGPRTWYAGTPERDGFEHDGRGTCLAVAIECAGALPQVSVVPVGRFSWHDDMLPLIPGLSAVQALREMLPAPGPGRRDILMRLRPSGRASLAEQAYLRAAVAGIAAEFCHFAMDAENLATEFVAEDLDDIDTAGALRHAAEALRARSQDGASSESARSRAGQALNRLYGYLREDGA